KVAMPHFSQPCRNWPCPGAWPLSHQYEPPRSPSQLKQLTTIWSANVGNRFVISILLKFDGLKRGLFQERFNRLLAVRCGDGFAGERLSVARGNRCGVVVAFEIRAVFQQSVAQLVGTGL